MQDDPFGHAAGPSFQVVEAQRESIAALIALWGFSDSGKTFSALRLARGLVGAKGQNRGDRYRKPPGEVLCRDVRRLASHRHAAPLHRSTLHSRGGGRHPVRCRLYHHRQHVPCLGGRRWGARPGRGEFSQRAGEVAGAEDGIHQDAQHAPALSGPRHLCLRAKEKFVQTGAGKSAQIVSTGHVPICDSLFIYEMTVSAKMESGTHKPIAPVKCPEGMKPSIIAGEFISEKSGEAIAEWAAGGVKLDHAALAVQAEARAKATEGTIKFRDWWQSIDRPQRAACKDIMPEIQNIATQADEEAARKAQELIRDANTGDDPLSDPFTQDAA